MARPVWASGHDISAVSPHAPSVTDPLRFVALKWLDGGEGLGAQAAARIWMFHVARGR